MTPPPKRIRLIVPILIALAVASCRSNEPEQGGDWHNSFAVQLHELHEPHEPRGEHSEPEHEPRPRHSAGRSAGRQWGSQRRRDHDDARDHRRPSRRRGQFYIGGNFGFTDGNESAGDLQDDINRRGGGGRSVTVDLDDTDVGYKAFLGYRFVQPFAIELGYTGLEGPNSTINAPVVDASLVADVLDLHPVTGRGPTLSVVGYPIRCGRFEMFTRIGVWYWEADVDVKLGGTVVRKDPNGWDPILGVGAQFRLFSQVRARVEYERYFLRNADIDLLSLGLTVGF
jgi:OmpA-like transmembrane domain